MLFRTEAQKRDLSWSWNRGDRAFFQAGACHILADAFLRRFSSAGFRPLMIQPVAGFRGGHIVAASPTVVFDWHGCSDSERYLAHYFRKLRQFYPGWNADVFELDDFMTPAFFQKFNHRAPDQYFRDPTSRAEAFVVRLLQADRESSSSSVTMPRIELTTVIAAPIETVFDLARNIDMHAASQSSHGEKAVAGRTSGLIEEGEEITWEAVHFGVRQRLTSRIVAMRRPTYFHDRMIQGAFERMDHDHIFEVSPTGTVMKDVFDYTAPLGVVGRFGDWLFLERYMRRLLEERNQVLKQQAEAVGRDR